LNGRRFFYLTSTETQPQPGSLNVSRLRRITHSKMNTTIPSEQLLRQLNWRYATKQFDPKRKISERDWTTLEQALLLSPSSFGVQPWSFIVVKDPAVRSKLLPASWGQKQIVDASHLVVFASRKNLCEADLDAHLERTADVRGVKVEELAPFRGILVGSLIQGMDDTTRDAWTKNQTYIALGNLLASAALLGIDACPMEGFDRAQYDEILGLSKRGLASAAVATLGYRSTEDKYATQAKVRFPRERVFIDV
jgi:nitroreductase